MHRLEGPASIRSVLGIATEKEPLLLRALAVPFVR
jgi:hypothetical protein